MAVKKEIELESETENMFQDGLTTAVPRKSEGQKSPCVSIFLPELEDSGEEGIKVDQYEHVTIANERGEKIYYVKRGEHVDVPVEVFIALKERYPKL